MARPFETLLSVTEQNGSLESSSGGRGAGVPMVQKCSKSPSEFRGALCYNHYFRLWAPGWLSLPSLKQFLDPKRIFGLILRPILDPGKLLEIVLRGHLCKWLLTPPTLGCRIQILHGKFLLRINDEFRSSYDHYFRLWASGFFIRELTATSVTA